MAWLALVAFLLAAPAAGGDPCADLRFTETAAGAGVVFTHDPGGRGDKHLPESMGAGLAWLDYDGDGWSDLYAVQSGPFPPNGDAAARDRLWRNLGPGADGRVTFEDVTERALPDLHGYGQGVLAADLDGDGRTDLYVTQFGPDVFLRNRGDGTFADATSAFGLGLDGWSSSAAAADADGDGDLDLYVTRYVVYDPSEELFCGDLERGLRRYCDPVLFAGAEDRFFVNQGGRFEDATAAAGLADAAGKGLGVVFADLDGDGRPDLYVANDITPNFLFHNLGPGGDGGPRFEDVSLFSGAAANREGAFEAGMGIALGDVDGDGDPDIAVTNFDVETNTFYENVGGLQFEDVSARVGFAVPSFNLLGFGVALADFDRDGALDAWVANGHIFERPARANVTYAQRDLLLLGDGRGGFRERRCPWLEEKLLVGRGLAVADYDRDGDVDVAIENNGGPLQLWRNDAAAGGWLAVSTDVVGTVVDVVDAAGRRRRRWVTAGDSYQSSSERRSFFGLGASAPATVEVAWPGGRQTRIVHPPAGRDLVLRPDSDRGWAGHARPTHSTAVLASPLAPCFRSWRGKGASPVQ